MMDKKPFYITTTIPYVNAEPHIGFALEILQADVLARYNRWKLGEENVFFSTGSDEHGQKIFEAAEKAEKDVKEYVDFYAAKFGELKEALDLSNDNFIRTTDPHHVKAAQEMWKRCEAAGDIYEKEFEGLYCVGCERYLTERDMADGKCVIHGTEPELRKEKNWFFRLSKYQNEILGYLQDPAVIIPDWRREEAINFVNEGLEDFSISREKSRLAWGVPVPGDDTQVMYVWFDALTNYISTLGWPDEGGNFEKFWKNGHTLQVAGKDQVRFQSIMWQGILLSAGIKHTDQVFYHGFVNSGGQKMSKSIGNVISPFELVKKYGIDATRYLVLRHIHSTEDTDVTWEKLDEWYEAGLVNGLGNLVSRIMKLAEDYLEPVDTKKEIYPRLDYTKELSKLDFANSMNLVWEDMKDIDYKIQLHKPFEIIKINVDEGKKLITQFVERMYSVAIALRPFLPKTSEKILLAIENNKKPENLFPRINA
ncbi:methionine--tRNA ligase [Candidatus Parcubacteria bacterium]|nr:methionine--tRNA ligase [Candidatus Parcubacteria bacterium]